MLRNRCADQVGSFYAACLRLLFTHIYSINGFSSVAAQFKPGHGRSCSFGDCTVRTDVGLSIWAV